MLTLHDWTHLAESREGELTGGGRTGGNGGGAGELLAGVSG